MQRLLVYLIVAVVALTLVGAAVPTLVLLLHALVPVVVTVGVVLVAVRLVWFFTDRH